MTHRAIGFPAVRPDRSLSRFYVVRSRTALLGFGYEPFRITTSPGTNGGRACRISKLLETPASPRSSACVSDLADRLRRNCRARCMGDFSKGERAEKMIRPSFQFYPADWRGNAKLRRCSHAARGAGVDIICVFHDSDEYGVCRWNLKDLCHSAGVPIALGRELRDKNVLKGADLNFKGFTYTTRHAGQETGTHELLAKCDGPCWFSSRMVRDEWMKSRRGAATRFDSKHQPSRIPNPTPTRRQGERQGDGSSSSSSSSSSTAGERGGLSELKIDSALGWLADWRKSGANYTESETRSAFLAMQANGWMWGKNPVVDPRAAVERQIQTDRERKAAKGSANGQHQKDPRRPVGGDF